MKGGPSCTIEYFPFAANGGDRLYKGVGSKFEKEQLVVMRILFGDSCLHSIVGALYNGCHFLNLWMAASNTLYLCFGECFSLAWHIQIPIGHRYENVLSITTIMAHMHQIKAT